MSVQKIAYSPEWHDRIIEFMVGQFPHRNKGYMEYWLSNTHNGGEKVWQNTVILVDGERIVGISLCNPSFLLHEGETVPNTFQWGNTIIDSTYRGGGLSKRIVEDRINLPNWLSFGIVDKFYAIQKHYLPNIKSIAKAFVFITPTLYIARALMRKMHLPIHQNILPFPEIIRLSSTEEIRRVHTVKDIAFPKNGCWFNDRYELQRDAQFVQSRFFDIYRADDYATYTLWQDQTQLGYLVVRTTRYAGVQLLSLVDFRILNNNQTYALRAAKAIATHCRLEAVITLTTLPLGTFCCSPFTIRMRKRINNACSFADAQYMLITSADSDLDFVYYK